MSALSFANMLFPDEYSVSGQLHRVTARMEVAMSGQANLPDHRVSFFAVETPGETLLTPTALSKVGNFLLGGRGTRRNPGTRDQCGPILLQPYSIGTITLAWSTRWPRRSPNAFPLLRRCGRSRTARHPPDGGRDAGLPVGRDARNRYSFAHDPSPAQCPPNGIGCRSGRW